MSLASNCSKSCRAEAARKCGTTIIATHMRCCRSLSSSCCCCWLLLCDQHKTKTGRARSRNNSRHKLDYQQVLDNLKAKGIAIRVASPKLVMEEAPESYKVIIRDAIVLLCEWGCASRVRGILSCAWLRVVCVCERAGCFCGGGHVSRGRHLQEGCEAAADRRHQGLRMGVELIWLPQRRPPRRRR